MELRRRERKRIRFKYFMFKGCQINYLKVKIMYWFRGRPSFQITGHRILGGSLLFTIIQNSQNTLLSENFKLLCICLCSIQYAKYSSLTTKVLLLQAGLAKLIGLAGETNVQVRWYFFLEQLNHTKISFFYLELFNLFDNRVKSKRN